MGGGVGRKYYHTLKLRNFINRKVSAITLEDRYRFAVRELVQNADDAGAETAVVLVSNRELVFANDGRPFNISEDEYEDDFCRICGVFGGYKEEEASGTSGLYGSGFHSVYCFTDEPVIVSNGHVQRLPLTETECPPRETEERTPFDTPVFRGALFRFPWREKSEHLDKGLRALKGWVWNEDEKHNLVESLKSYLPDLILCLRNVRILRLVSRLPRQTGGWMVRRDFGLDVPDSAPKIRLGRVEVGEIELPDEADEREDLLVHKWRGEPSRWEYLIGSAWVTSKPTEEGGWGNPLYFGRGGDGRETITEDRAQLRDQEGKERILLKNDIHVLLPLSGERKYPKYAVLPLPPPESPNLFACSAHLIAREDRTQLDLGTEERKRWYEKAIHSLSYLYVRVLDEYLRRLGEDLERHKDTSGKVPEDKLREIQKDILRVLPLGSPGVWVDPRGGESKVFSQLEFELGRMILKRGIIPQPDGTLAALTRVLRSGDRPESTGCVLPEDEEEREIALRLGARVVGKDLTDHDSVKLALEWVKGGPPWRSLTDAFGGLWGKFTGENCKDGGMELGQDLKDGSSLDDDFVKSLMRFCLRKAKEKYEDCYVVPCVDGKLRMLYTKVDTRVEKEGARVPPKGYEELYDLLPAYASVHERFRDFIDGLVREEKEGSQEDCSLRALEALKLLSYAVQKQQDRFSPVQERDLELIVRVVAKALPDMAVTNLKGLRSLPYSQGGKIWIGELNLDKEGKLLDRAEKLTREHILWQDEEEVPGLTPEIRKGLKMLHLPGMTEEAKGGLRKWMEDEYEGGAEGFRERMGNVFRSGLKTGKDPNIPRLRTGKDPSGLVNLIRVCVAKGDGGSLFEDEVLKKFLKEKAGIEPTPGTLEEQKRKMLYAVQMYFDKAKKEEGLEPKDMEKVPCLYDTEGKWWPCGEFGLLPEGLAELVNKRALHQDLQKWPKETLEALGVRFEKPQPEDIIIAVRELTARKERKKLEGLLKYILNTYDGELERLKRELGGLEWIPTQEGLRRPGDSLLPTTPNVKLLGKGHPAFIALEALGGEGRAEKVKNRAERLGIRLEPTTEELLELVRRLMESKEAPPEELFDRLSDRLSGLLKGLGPGGRRKLLEGKKLGYYTQGRWWPSERIRFGKIDKVIEDFIREHLVVLPREHKHASYLESLGVGELTAYDVLEKMRSDARLGEKDPEAWKKVWARMADLDWPQDPGKVSQYRREEIYPCEGGFRRPERLLVRGAGLEPGELGKGWYVVPADDGAKALKKLDVKGAEELTAQDILELLRSEFDRTKEAAGKLLKLWQMLADRERKGQGPSRGSRADLWVPLLSSPWVGKGPEGLYLNDHPVADKFGHKVLMDGGIEGLSALYQKLGARSLRRAVRVSRMSTPGRAEKWRWVEMEEKLRELWGLGWEVYKMPTVSGEYRLEEESRTLSGYRLDVEKGEGGTTIRLWIAEYPPREMLKYLPSELFELLRDEGVEIGDEHEALYKLLFEPPPLVEEYSVLGGAEYWKASQDLGEMYKGCQICHRLTPKNAETAESFEGVKRVITRRGGRYRPRREEPGYDIGNCLYLCPSHQKLFERGLVRLMVGPEAGSTPEEEKRALAGAIRNCLEELRRRRTEEKKGLVQQDCWVYEYEDHEYEGHQYEGGKASWRKRTVFFTWEHWEKFLKCFASHWEGYELPTGVTDEPEERV